MKLRSLYLSILLALTCLNLSAQQNSVLKQVVDKLNLNGGARIDFILQENQNNSSVPGTYYASGKMFKIESDALRAWYDGADLWLYVSQNGEVNLSHPTADEIAEINPLVNLQLIDKNDFSISSEKKGNGFLITAKPQKGYKGTTQWVKVATDKNYTPLYVEVKDCELKHTLLVKITKVSNNLNKPKSFFVFNKRELPNAPVIDLR